MKYVLIALVSALAVCFSSCQTHPVYHHHGPKMHHKHHAGKKGKHKHHRHHGKRKHRPGAVTVSK